MRSGRRGILAGAIALVCLLAPATAPAAVYWGSGGGIGAANNDGSMLVGSYPYEIANAPPEGSVVGIAVNETHLFWGDLTHGAIGSMALSGTPDGRVLFNEPKVWTNEALVPNVERPWGVAVDATHLYWASTAGAIGRSNLDGSAADRNFIDGLDSPCGIAVDGQYLYWGEIGPGTIGRARLDGSGVDPEFITGASDPCGVAVDGSHVYWSNAGSIGRSGLDGGAAPSSPFISNAGRPCGLAVDGSHLYWANFDESGTYASRANLDGSGAGPLVGAEYRTAMCGVAVDSRVFQLRPASTPASLPIRFGSLERRKRGRLLVLPVYVPERGELTLTFPRNLGWSLDKGSEPLPSRGGAFRWTLKLWPGKGRVGKRIRRQLGNHRRAPVQLQFNWGQQGRAPVATSKQISFGPPPRSTRSGQ